MEKYELTEENKVIISLGKEIVLHRIRAIQDFGNIKAGTLGGWIESENNLSQKRNCWIKENVNVYGNAKVYENAIINDCVNIYGNAHIHGKARIYGNVEIYGNANIEGNAKIFGDNYEINPNVTFKAIKYDIYPHEICEFYGIETKDKYENTNDKLHKDKTRISGNVHITDYAIIGDEVILNKDEYIDNGFYNRNEKRKDICSVYYTEETRHRRIYLVQCPELDTDKYYTD